MADEAETYRIRAAEQRAAAAAADLDNVRDRCARAAAAWETMAERAERTRTMREQREAATVARVAAG